LADADRLDQYHIKPGCLAQQDRFKEEAF